MRARTSAGRPGRWGTAIAVLAAATVATAVAVWVRHAGAHPLPPLPHGRGGAWIRVDQVGYAPGARKTADLLTRRPATGARVEVVDDSGRAVLRLPIGRPRVWHGRAARVVSPLDLTALRTPGRYAIVAHGPVTASSPWFEIASASAVDGPLAARALGFFAVQRDARTPASLVEEGRATVMRAPAFHGVTPRLPLVPLGAPPVDVTGGWRDAGDDLKLVETGSFADLLLLRTALDGGPDASAIAAAARVETDWLLRMWHPRTGTLDYQVGLGDGNGRLLGDHDLWRLPEHDAFLPGGPQGPDRYIVRPPVFRDGVGTGRISPNLAGRLAAAFALCARVEHRSDPAYAARCLQAGKSILAHADTHPRGRLVTAVPYAYYPETTWRDDLALGATELGATIAADGDPASRHPLAEADGDLFAADKWLESDIGSAQADRDSFGLYDVTAMADAELASALADAARHGRHPTDNPRARDAAVADLADRLRLATSLSRRDPFGLADPARPADEVSHALGQSLTADWYDRLAGTRRYAGLASGQLDWVLGRNAWGTSFVVGAGTTFPECLQHQITNLTDSLDGRGRLLLGATVPGPEIPAAVRATFGVPDGARACPAGGGDRFRAFDTPAAVYRDDVRSSQNTEPSVDLNALAVAAFSAAAAG